MEWWQFLIAFLGALFFLLLLRVPVGFAMLGVGLIGAVYAFGTLDGALNQVALSVMSSVSSFTFTAIPLFILMGEVLFRSRAAQDALDEIAIVLSRLPGRLSMVTVGGGAMFGLLSGSTLANTALFGKTLLPQMKSKGYSEKLAIGSVMASGGLAMILPPSALGILWGAVAEVPIGPLLIAGIIPGIMMAVGYATIVSFWSLKLGGTPKEPPLPKRTVSEAFVSGVRRALGPGVIVALVLGLIFLGIATPTESAAVGATAAILLSVVMGRFSLKMLRDALIGTAHMSGMIFFILLGSNLYGQLMSYTGATAGLVQTLTGSITSSALMLLVIMAILLVLGALIDQASIMLVTAPLFMPIVAEMGWDPIWFSMLLLMNLQIAQTTPPFGMSLFVMKAVSPKTKMGTIYRSVLPWITWDLICILILATFPILVTFLPSLIGG